eukprot:gene13359-33811_t
MADFSHLLEVSGNQRERVRSTSSSSEPGSPTRSGSNVGSVNTRAPTGSPRRRKGGNTPSHHDVDRSSSKGTATGRRSADAAALGAGGRRPSAAPVIAKTQELDDHAMELVRLALRQGVLLHEVDQGQPCTSCADCPGFELHFWRKRCIHCRCNKWTHRTRRLAAPVLPGQLQGLQDLNAMAQVEADLMAMAMGTAQPVAPIVIQKAS